MSWSTWVWAIIIAVVVGGYALYRRGKLPWLSRLKGIRLPKLFEPKPGALVERLKADTEKEKTKAVELQRVLEAKRELVLAKAENARLRREIACICEETIEEEQQERQRRQAAKPRGLR